MEQIWIPPMSPDMTIPPGKKQSKTCEDGWKSLVIDSDEGCREVKEDEDQSYVD